MTGGELGELVGHRFPGGTYRIERWENFLLTDCTGRSELADGLVHPVALFHVPILGARTSITELFVLGGATGAGSVGLEGYDWEYHRPLRQDVEYRVEGGIVSAERRRSDSGRTYDAVAFQIELTDPDAGPAARITNRWRFRRSAPASATASPSGVDGVSDRASGASSGGTADELPPWRMESVDPARMKTMAAILRDPYPVHWDPDAVEAMGLGHRVVNQGPLNLGYIANMLMAWAGDDAVRRLTVSFGRPVLDGDDVTARGRVTDRTEVDGERRAVCEVWLDRAGEHVVDGTAQVTVSE